MADAIQSNIVQSLFIYLYEISVDCDVNFK